MNARHPLGGDIGRLLDRLASLESRQRRLSFDELRKAVLGGDGEAWGRLVEKYSRFVYTVALRLLAGSDDREEQAAHIYSRVFERLAARRFRLLRGFRGRCRFTTYLYRMVQSERKATFARRHAGPLRELENAAAPLGAASQEPPVLRPQVLRRAARHALATLDPHDRLLLVLRYRDGLKLRQIAAAAGYKDTNAAAYAVRRALSRLDLLRQLRRSQRLGPSEVRALGQILQQELFDAEAPAQKGAWT